MASPVGTWRIVEMDLWDQDAVDLVAPGFIRFQGDHTGSLGFIALGGSIDWRVAGGRTEFSWDGFDEGDPVTGRGWAEIGADGTLRGHLFIHLGDDSGFRAERLPTS